MIRFVKSIAVVLFGISMLFLTNFFDLKYLFPSADSVKSTFKESNVYSLVAAGIRTNLIDSTTGPERDVFSDIVNDAINPATIQDFTDRTVDQFYTIIQKPDAIPVLTLPFSIFGDRLSPSLVDQNIVNVSPETNSFMHDRKVDLHNNPLYILARNLKLLIGTFAIVAGLLLLVLVLPEAWPKKLKWAGNGFLFAGVLVLVEAAAYIIGLSARIQNNIITSTGLDDDKYLLAAQKILNTILANQKVYFSIVAAALLIIGIVLLVFAKKLGKKEVKDLV